MVLSTPSSTTKSTVLVLLQNSGGQLSWVTRTTFGKCKTANLRSGSSSVRRLIAAAAVEGTVINEYADLSSPAHISKTMIRLNGDGANAHECFTLERTNGGRAYCKTARKPYDRVVCGVLLAGQKYAPGVWQIHSDGNHGDWEVPAFWAGNIVPDLRGISLDFLNQLA